MAEDQKREPGRRKDGKPFKKGNTREDGSYKLGKNRAPKEHRFQVGDGRKRGTRPKGTKNLMTDWHEELARQITVSEGGKPRKVTKQRATVIATIDRGIKKSDHAVVTILRHAELSEKREPGLQADDRAIIEAWLGRILRASDSDDADELPPDTRTEDDLTGKRDE